MAGFDVDGDGDYLGRRFLGRRLVGQEIVSQLI